MDENDSVIHKGAIVRLSVMNFMSFSKFVWIPDSKFNVVLGHNGAGKSSLMCAICLVMGGHPSLSGRSGNIKRFVKSGCTSCSIEVELHRANNDGSNLKIKREIGNGFSQSFRKQNSIFWLNGKKVTLDDILVAVSRLNIDLSSLCQYLPQDRVTEFNRKSSSDLLKEIESCVENKKLLEMHNALIAVGNKEKEEENSLKLIKESIRITEAAIERLQVDVERIEKLKELKKQLVWLKIKQAWNGFEELSESARSQVQMVPKQREVLISHQNKVVEKTNEISVLKHQADQSSRKLTEMKDAIDAIKRLVSNKSEYADTIDAELNRIQGDDGQNDELDEILSEVRAKIKKCETEIVSLNNELLLPEKDCSEKKDNIKSRLRETRRNRDRAGECCQRILVKMTKCKEEIRSLNGKLKSFKPFKQQALEYVKSVRPDVYTAHQWIAANGHIFFKRRVFDPPIISIRMNDPEIYKYIEATIPSRDFLSLFLFESLDDLKVFMVECHDKLKLNINAGTIGDQLPDTNMPIDSISEFQKFDFKSCLASYLIGPPKVTNYLRQSFGLDYVMIGPESIQKRIGEITQRFPKLSLFFAGFNRYNVINSRYTSGRSTISRCISDSRFRPQYDGDDDLSVGLGAKLKKAEDTLETFMVDFKRSDEERSSFEEEVRNFELMLSEVNSGTVRVREIEARLNRLKGALVVFKEQESDIIERIESKVPEMVAHFSNLNETCNKIASFDMEKLVVEILEEDLNLKYLKINQSISENSLEEFKNQLLDIKSQVKNAKYFLDRAKRLLESSIHEIQVLLIEGEITEPRFELTMDNEALPTASKEFKSFIDSVCVCDSSKQHEGKCQLSEMLLREAVLNGEIADLKCEKDDEIIEQFYCKRNQLDELYLAVQNAEHNKQFRDKCTDTEKINWITGINKYIATAAKKFQELFRLMGYEGTMKLLTPSNSHDFAEYGVEISVSFRNLNNTEISDCKDKCIVLRPRRF
ncbi:hypothetical protein ACOME3_004515 [Neoechinorhynchus agilis]